jgi:hypothetical protein
MAGQKPTKSNKKILMAEKVRIVTLQEEEVLAPAIADRLGRQSRPCLQVLSNEYLAAYSTYIHAQENPLRHQEWWMHDHLSPIPVRVPLPVKFLHGTGILLCTHRRK